MKKTGKEIRKLIANGNSENAISILIEDLEENKGKWVNEATILSGRLSELNRKNRGGIISYSDFNLESIKINYAILNILDEIEGEKKVIQKEKGNSLYFSKALDKFEILIKKHNTFERIQNLKVSQGKVLDIPDSDSFKNSIEYHKKNIGNWAKSISFKDLKKSKDTNKIYVELDFFLVPRKLHIEENTFDELINIRDVFSISNQNIVVLGQPGAGKTTTMKMIVNWCLKEDASILANFQFPLVVRLRELNDGLINFGIFEKLFEILGISILDLEDYEKKIGVFKKLLINLLDDLSILVILDGFDELKYKLKEKTIIDIRQLTDGLSNSKFILTSRTGDFNEYIENTNEFEISPLNQDQIKSFINNWLQDQQKSEDLFHQIKNSPFADTAIRPLTLSHLCALYERFLKIPEKPKTVYRKVVNLLIEEWDLQRGIVREGSKYSLDFEVDRKFEFLSHLAYFLTTQFNKTTFTSKELLYAYLNICQNFSLPVYSGASDPPIPV